MTSGEFFFFEAERGGESSLSFPLLVLFGRPIAHFVLALVLVLVLALRRREREREREKKLNLFATKKTSKTNSKKKGNPAEKQFHECIGAYAPVDNVVPGAKYPTILVTAGLHDPRVGYWEPAKVKMNKKTKCFFRFFFRFRFFFAQKVTYFQKIYKNTKNIQWVARIRELGKPRGPVIFKCDLGAGHFSKSGRFDRLSEVALEHGFLLKTFGLLRAERKVKKSK